MREYTLTLPDGSKEAIPSEVCPVWRNNGWCSTNTDADIRGTALALAQAEREAVSATARVKYLRGLMGRVLAAQANAEPCAARGAAEVTPCEVPGLDNTRKASR